METHRATDFERAETRPMLSPLALAGLLGVPVQTVYAWRSRGGGPPAHRVGRHLRYSLSDVEAWLAERRDGRSEEVCPD